MRRRRRRIKKNFLSNFFDTIMNGINNIGGKNGGKKIKVRSVVDDEKRKDIIIWCACILGSILLAFLTIQFAFERTVVSDDSMSKTLNKTDKILINKFAYNFSSPERFDVVVFEQKDKEHNFYNIKRVIGLPNEKISIQNGHVFVNGDRLEEKVVVDKCKNPGLADSELELEEDEYFVLGDNRNNSEDSRFANIGVVKEKDLVGSAWVRINTLSLVKNLNNVVDTKKEE